MKTIVELPDEHKPRHLKRAPTQGTVYGIGMSSNGKDFGMAYGPVKDIMEVLDHIPPKPSKEEPHARPFIVGFNSDKTISILYEWIKDRWIKLAPQKK